MPTVGGVEPSGAGDWVVALIGSLPGYLWVGLAAWALWLLKAPLRNAVIPRLSRFEGFGMTLELEAARESLDAAVEVAEKHPNWPVRISATDRNRAARRAVRSRELLKGACLLWVDDFPANNRNEQRMLKELGLEVVFATSTKEALNVLTRSPAGFDAIISDMARVENEQENKCAGLDFLAAYKQGGGRLPVIFYIGVPDPSKGVPPGAFGLTYRPDELLHLVIDALERERG